MRGRTFAAAALVYLLSSAGACTKQPARTDPLVQRAQFGIFFGGQVQERSEIPFDLDQTQQTQGFRLDFSRPLARTHSVGWEIDMPGTGRGARGRIGKGRRVHVGEELVHAGRKRLDHVLQFEPGDPLGVWNVRVTVDRQIVIDRMFLMYDEERRQRERASRDGGT